FCLAGDGIRDRNVTGVQTCALPIFTPCHIPHLNKSVIHFFMNLFSSEFKLYFTIIFFVTCSDLKHVVSLLCHIVISPLFIIIKRSEERRVGKQSRGGGMKDV